MKVNRYAEKLNELIKEVKTNYDKAKAEQAFCDIAINDIYHYIEFTDLTVSQMIEATNKLQNILQRRRKAKNVIRDANQLNSFIKIDWNNIQYLKTDRDCLYTYKTDIIKEKGEVIE